MMRSRRDFLRRWCGAAFAVAASGAAGCSDSSKTEGTVVAVPDSFLEDAKRSDAAYDAMSKSSRKKR